MTSRHFSTIPDAVTDIRKGKFLIIVDSPKRENEADLFIAADKITPRAITTMVRRGGGILCTALTREHAKRLQLPLMIAPEKNAEKTGVNFTVSVNAKRGVTTGVSAHDRAKTIRVLANPRAGAKDIVKPGHVSGLIARDGGVVERKGHTEAAVDLARLAGLSPAGVLCEIVGKSGRMAKRDEIFRLARELKCKIITIEELVKYIEHNPLPPLSKQSDVTRVSSAALPTRYGKTTIVAYTSVRDGREHAALIFGKPHKNPLVRVHSSCLTGDALFSLKCDCGPQLEESMRRIERAGSGILVYLSQEGRGIGLSNKVKAYALQDKGYDTVEANHALGFKADARTYEDAADILEDLGIRDIRLLTNNPEKERQLSRFGIHITDTVPLEIKPNRANRAYLKTKKKKLGHRLSV